MEIESQVLCVASLVSPKSFFIVGAQNELCLILADDQISSVKLAHPKETINVASSFSAPNIISTSYNMYSPKSTIWKFPETILDKLVASEMEPLVTLEVSQVAFDPTASLTRVIGRKKNQFSIFSLSEGAATAMEACSLDFKKTTNMSWSPHSSTVAVSHDSGISLIDLRRGQVFMELEFPSCRCVDFNPNKSHYLVCGDDLSIGYWDIRNPIPLKKQVHSHWIQSVQYNKFHDQLVLSASTDSNVLLHSFSSVKLEQTNHTPLEDGVVACFDQHEDSVHCAWSLGDPWVFCSASYDGRVMINTLPTEIKYSIIMV